MSLAWFSVHNLTMFQISATAGNLCLKTVSEIHAFGEKVLCQLCWNCAILISSTASQIRGADYFVGKKKKKEKKCDVKSLQFQFPVTWLSNSWKRGDCFGWSARMALRLKRKEQVCAAMFVTPSKKMSWEINYTHTHKKREQKYQISN